MTTPMYASFLVRLWREEQSASSEPAADWQSELKHIQSGDRWTFSTLDELLGFLRQQAEEPEVLSQSANEREEKEGPLRPTTLADDIIGA